MPTEAVDVAEAGVGQVIVGEPQSLGQVIPALGCPTDLVLAHDIAVVATAAEVAAGLPSVLTGEQSMVIPGRSLADDVLQNVFSSAVLTLARFGVAEGDAGFVCQTLDRSDEVELFLLLNEGDDVAADAAAEAVVEAVLGVDRERGTLFCMERTQGLISTAHALELGVLRDDGHHIGGLSNPHNVLVNDSHSLQNYRPGEVNTGH